MTSRTTCRLAGVVGPYRPAATPSRVHDDALPGAVREAVRWHWDGPLPPEEVARDMQMADMLLLLGDRRRVWWRDLGGVFAGEEAYVATLTEWAEISRGAFAPD